MRLSEIEGKEIINLEDGEKLGAIGDSELVFDEATGMIEGIVLPERGGLLGSLFKDRREMTIPWTAVKKIGPEVIIVELPAAKYGFTWSRRRYE